MSAAVARSFERVDPLPASRPELPAKLTRPGSTEGSPIQHGAWCDRFQGDWDKLPDFSTLEPSASGPVSVIELSSDTNAIPGRAEHVALRFRGFVELPSDDVYAFELTSDDGSRLLIDGAVVVDADGLHSATTKRGHVALARGDHAIQVEWFNKTGGAELAIRVGALGQELLPISVHHEYGSKGVR